MLNYNIFPRFCQIALFFTVPEVLLKFLQYMVPVELSILLVEGLPVLLSILRPNYILNKFNSQQF